MSKIISSLVLCIMLTSFFSFILIQAPVLADAAANDYGLSKTGKSAKLLPKNKDQDVATIAGKIVNGLLSLVGIIFMVLIIWSGVKWMISMGNQGKVTEAKNLLINSIIGLVIVLGAYLITNYILEIIMTGLSVAPG